MNSWSMPRSLEIGGRPYEVRWDFTSCMGIMAMLEDGELAEREKAELLVQMLYPSPPADRPAALERGLWFIGGGEDRAAAGGPRLFSLVGDYRYIYTAILARYGVEPDERLHWWRFCRMVCDLGDDCLFNRLVYLRRRRLQGKLSREESKQLSALEQGCGRPDAGGCDAGGARGAAAEFFSLLRGDCITQQDTGD